MKRSQGADEIRRKILRLVGEYFQESRCRDEFIPGESLIPYGGRVFDDRELTNLVEASLDFWLTHGEYSQKFETELGRFLDLKHCYFVNSGSSANLLAFMALTSPNFPGEGIQKGDEVITVAACFPTTVTPVIQYGAVPVFVDIELPSYNVDPRLLSDALSPRTRAVMLAHTLGNPFNIEAITQFCRQHDLWLIEDNCDSLGSRYKGKLTGTFGDLATSSFYPPHHMTTGEGGAVYTDDEQLALIVASLRDWGRDCSCPSGMDDTCGHRFSQSFGLLPKGYDHKYVYSRLGYNLKATDLQAAIGVAQLEKLPGFVEARRRNWDKLRTSLADLEDLFILPEATPDADPSWFGFALTVREGAPFERDDIVRYLEDRRIQTRVLFAGNLIKHPCFDHMRDTGKGFRVAGDLPVTDLIMRSAFWVGVYPGMTDEHLDYMINIIREFAGR